MYSCVYTRALGLALTWAVLASSALAELGASVVPSAHPVRPGEPATFRAALTGVEEGAAYTLLPPEPGKLPELIWGGIAWEGLKISTGADGQPETALEFTVTATEPGNYEIPALQLRAIPVSKDAPLPGETLDLASAVVVATKPVTISVQVDLMPYYLGGGAAAACVLLVVVAVYLALRNRKLRKQRQVVVTGSPQEQAQEHLHLARRHRLDGNFYQFYRSLAAAARALESSNGQAALSPKLDARAQDVGYRDVRPTEDEMDGAIKELERALMQRKEDQ